MTDALPAARLREYLPGDARNSPRLISWRGRSGSGIAVPVTWEQADAVHLLALHMAVTHYELGNPGAGAAIAHYLRETDPAAWEKFKGAAIDCIRALHGHGAKDMSDTGVKDGMSPFRALGELATHLRRDG